MTCQVSVSNISLGHNSMKSCIKKPEDSTFAPRGSALREILRRASSGRVSISDILKYQSTEATADLSDSSLRSTSSPEINYSSHSSERRASESIRSLFAKLGSSRQVFVEKKRESVVRFSDVCIREYDVTASHHPGSRSGVPIELGWKYNILDPQSVNLYEFNRATTRSSHITEKKLTPVDRRRILKEHGVTDAEIEEASKYAAILRNKRKRSLQMRKHDGLYESMEEFGDQIKKMFGCKGKNSTSCAVASAGLHPSFWNDPKNIDTLYLLDK
jgi:hypothetical protein